MSSKARAKLLNRMEKLGGTLRDLTQPIEKISTGSLVMDYDLQGGLPKRRIIEIFGPPNTGKTTLSTIFCGEAIRRGESVLFIDQERSFSPEWAIRLGVDVEARNESGDLMLDVMDFQDAETALQFLLEAVRENVYGLVIFDTVAKISPKAENEAEFDKNTQIGAQAKMMTRLCRVLGDPLAKSDTTIVALNQVREDLASMYGGKTSAGGNGFHHEAALRLQTYTTAEVWRNGNKKDRIDYLTIRWKMKKTKVSDFDGMMHEVTLEHLENSQYVVDANEELFQLGKVLDIFCNEDGTVWSGRGNAFFPYNDPNDVFEGETLYKLGNGQANIKVSIGENFDLFTAIRGRVMENMGKVKKTDESATD